MTLRQWQAECITRAYQAYCGGQPHFLCLATPGAGKTWMASALAKRLLDAGLVDLVVCFAPSVIVADDFRTELETQFEESFDSLLGSRGRTLTYQAMLSINDSFWDLFRRQRVFAIFDEIHHCAGQTPETANAWGERVISRVQGQAAYTLALTGTPWRSDAIPIALSNYCRDNGQIHCDYKYGLARAIADGVCRSPQLTIVDNDRITIQRGNALDRYTNFRELLAESECTYQQLLETEALITYILQQANHTLTRIRATSPNAGGLIVAASVSHAHFIADLLVRTCGENAAIATYREDDPLATIRRYKRNRDKWIISVGMISEGTNVPRLRVCCHLTRVKTELYFRQILGRILRANGLSGEKGYLNMPAEPTLIEYAERLAEDIPTVQPVKFDVMRPTRGGDLPSSSRQKNPPAPTDMRIILGTKFTTPVQPTVDQSQSIAPSTLRESYELTLNMLGRFHRELLTINGLDSE
ncbi:DEAD/DEAH box helicase [Spongiibacter marinus]|uniref:DEAD/DEAH box helicase n=1 Tax=Spongiibacter marinus TaxID=354246 RepID=UPI0019616B6D|nr:DEAD/DEAH box helicase family protein [Spongiibacter marinus]